MMRIVFAVYAIWQQTGWKFMIYLKDFFRVVRAEIERWNLFEKFFFVATFDVQRRSIRLVRGKENSIKILLGFDLC